MEAMTLEPDAQMPFVDHVAAADQYVVLYDVSWERYEALLAVRGANRRPRMTYLDGAVELMTTSEHHERVRFLLGRLLERYAIALGVNLVAYGQTTFKARLRGSGLEADEAYAIGAPRGDRPDLALEVVWTNGGLDKLEAYRSLGVPEVWMWRRGELRVHVLGDGGYEERDRSVVLAAADLALLASFLDRPGTTDTIAAFERALAAQLLS
jgi:Uma2 family endonuclease